MLLVETNSATFSYVMLSNWLIQEVNHCVVYEREGVLMGNNEWDITLNKVKLCVTPSTSPKELITRCWLRRYVYF